MLRRLLIRDFVIVDKLEMEFDGGFSALTGETGAGKSILIDALSLPGRTLRCRCYWGKDKAEVSAEFDLAPDSLVAEWLRKMISRGRMAIFACCVV